jgi:hypothetical protein
MKNGSKRTMRARRRGPKSVTLVSLIDSVVEQLSQVFMLRVFHVGTIC